MSLGLCIVGCGWYAGINAEVIRKLDEPVELFFASRDMDKAREYCRRFDGTDCFGSYEEGVRDNRVEAMYILTPNNLHRENAIMAAQNSKHVLVEKPIARTLAEADEMIAAAREASVKLMVAENARFMPTTLKCKELLDQEAIGPVRLIQIQVEHRSRPRSWRGDLEVSGGGAFLEGGIHWVNVMITLAGKPRSVYGAKLRKVVDRLEAEDGMVMMAQMANGATGLINFSWANVALTDRSWASVTGTRGRIDFEARGQSLSLDTGDVRNEYRFDDDLWGTEAMVREFIVAIRENREPLVTGDQGRDDLAVVIGAYESVKKGSPITIG